MGITKLRKSELSRQTQRVTYTKGAIYIYWIESFFGCLFIVALVMNEFEIMSYRSVWLIPYIFTFVVESINLWARKNEQLKLNGVKNLYNIAYVCGKTIILIQLFLILIKVDASIDSSWNFVFAPIYIVAIISTLCAAILVIIILHRISHGIKNKIGVRYEIATYIWILMNLVLFIGFSLIIESQGERVLIVDKEISARLIILFGLLTVGILVVLLYTWILNIPLR